MRGQIGLWVLVGIGILALFGLFFIIQQGPRINLLENNDPSAYITTCARTATREILEQLIVQGGLTNPSPSFLYNNISRVYLCYHRGYFEPCIMQHPFLLEETRQDILSFITPRIRDCFTQLQATQEARGAEVTMQELSVNVTLVPEKLILSVERDVVLRRQGQTQHMREFSTDIRTSLYTLLDIAREISNQEAEHCYFEYVGYTLLYPRFQIEKTTLGEGTKVYTLIDLTSRERFIFGTRGCAIPPGI